MKTLAALTMLLIMFYFKQSRKDFPPKFNGLYQTECYLEKGDDEGNQDYLRFYADGKVIDVVTDCEGSVSELKGWFKAGAEQVGIGEYKVVNNKIKFSTKSRTAIVDYTGMITKDGFIILKSKSQTTGSKGRGTYRFIEMNDLN
ncbi:hypothetical protein [Hymenobacter sp. CRA2]|uniref:hypothetical protein n=1 Tax=Hymenobacter sp. CRA2 TaxID=1955620 RepID=UPI00098FF6FC|nr:hypothetical protein [Hymenobacter sp. CRA2]OON68716.1 hypothetical protein B0919_11020 [Hymenobacter sp. CRA2]